MSSWSVSASSPTLGFKPIVEHLAGTAPSGVLVALSEPSTSSWSTPESSGYTTGVLSMDRICLHRRMARSKGSMAGSILASVESGVASSDTILSRT